MGPRSRLPFAFVFSDFVPSLIPAAARRIVEIANAVEPVQDGRVFIELINAAQGHPAEYKLVSIVRSEWLAVTARPVPHPGGRHVPPHFARWRG